MKYFDIEFENKKLPYLSVGTMRFPSSDAAIETIHKCVENGAYYLDTAPGYCHQSNAENSEVWVGRALKGIRDKVILSAKCSPGNGGNEIGQYDPDHGYNVTTADNVRFMIEQTLKRQNVDYLDFYQMWVTNSMKIFEVAAKKDGWLDGVLKAKDEGLIKHIGLTSHAGGDELKSLINTGCFEMITVPFNMLDMWRLDCIEYAQSKGIAVMGMNALAGGLLASAKSEKFNCLYEKYNAHTMSALSLKFNAAFGVSSLSGMTSANEAQSNIAAFDSLISKDQALDIRDTVNSIIDSKNFKCTSCGYCMPCPQKINIPEVMKSYNHYFVLGMEGAKEKLNSWHWWNEGFKVENCVKCGACERKCPNGVDTMHRLEQILSLR